MTTISVSDSTNQSTSTSSAIDVSVVLQKADEVSGVVRDGVNAAIHSAFSMFDVRQLACQLAHTTRDVFDAVTGVRRFKDTFPTIYTLTVNPKVLFNISGTYLDYTFWEKNPLEAARSMSVSFGSALPQSAALAYGVGPTLMRGPTVGEFASGVKVVLKEGANTVGHFAEGTEAILREVAGAVGNFGDRILPPPTAMTTAGIMMPISAVAESSAIAAGGAIANTGGMLSPLAPILLAMAASNRASGGGLPDVDLKIINEVVYKRIDEQVKSPDGMVSLKEGEVIWDEAKYAQHTKNWNEAEVRIKAELEVEIANLKAEIAQKGYEAVADDLNKLQRACHKRFLGNSYFRSEDLHFLSDTFRTRQNGLSILKRMFSPLEVHLLAEIDVTKALGLIEDAVTRNYQSYLRKDL